MQRLIEARIRKEKPELGKPIAFEKKKAEPSAGDVAPRLLEDKELKSLLGQRRFKSIAELLDDPDTHLLDSQCFKLLTGLLDLLVQIVKLKEKPADLETFEEFAAEEFESICSGLISKKEVKGKVSKKYAASCAHLLVKILLHAQ